MTPMIVEHPLLQHKLSILRNKQTGTKEFRDLVGEIATLLCYEATRDLPLEEVEIETPITMAKTKVLAGRKLALVPILRAGMGMLDGMLTLLPAAKVGFIGLYRDEETLQPVEYFCKLPQDIAERDVLVLDPMLATGGSAIDAITQIKKHGAKRIKFIGLIAAPEGIKALHEAHPDVDIYLGAEDDHLNEERLYRSRSGRRRRPHLRHQVKNCITEGQLETAALFCADEKGNDGCRSPLCVMEKLRSRPEWRRPWRCSQGRCSPRSCCRRCAGPCPAPCSRRPRWRRPSSVRPKE